MVNPYLCTLLVACCWQCKIAESLNRGIVQSQNRSIAESFNRRIVQSRNRSIVESQNR